jgi:Uma2 family endonuclease
LGVAEKIFYSVEEYLALEENSSDKHEYFNSEIFAMSGGASIPHTRIVSNLFTELGIKLKGKKCRPFGSDLRIHVPLVDLYTYPDLSIFCEPIEKSSSSFDTAINPTVIIEVISKSTKDYDKGSKFTMYRSIPALKEYILIDSEQIFVERYNKNLDNTWTLEDIKDIHQSFSITSINETLALQDIYVDVF